jgi:hypothetical protein
MEMDQNHANKVYGILYASSVRNVRTVQNCGVMSDIFNTESFIDLVLVCCDSACVFACWSGIAFF